MHRTANYLNLNDITLVLMLVSFTPEQLKKNLTSHFILEKGRCLDFKQLFIDL